MLGYVAFGQHLNQTGRPMVYSCSWPVYQQENGIEVRSAKKRFLLIFYIK